MTEADRVESDDSAPGIIPKSISLIISAATIGLYLLCWLIYWIFKSGLWGWSVETSEDWSDSNWFWAFYYWIFSGPLYIWWIALIGILIVLSPRRASAFKSIFIYFVSVWTMNHFRQWSSSSRPMWVSEKIEKWESCNCGFGMPAPESEVGFMMYALVVYELFMHTRHFTNAGKWVWFGLAAFIILNITLSRIYYGQASIPQTFIGMLHGAAWFGGMMLLSNPLTVFFRGVLNGVRMQQFIFLGISAFMFLFSLIFFYSAYDGSNRDSPIEHATCNECFVNGNREVRNKMARAFAYPTMLLGIALGILIYNPRYEGKNDFMLEDHVGVKGGTRIGLMAALHLPLFFLLWPMRPGNTFWFFSLIWLIVGVLVTLGFYMLVDILGCRFRGDLSKHEATTEAEGLLSNQGANLNFNPYNKSSSSPQRPNQLPSSFNSGAPTGNSGYYPARKPPV